MKRGERLSLEQIKLFLLAREEFRFEASHRGEVYDWVTKTLVEYEYSSQKREAKGVIRSHIPKMTGLSRAQGTRLASKLDRGEKFRWLAFKGSLDRQQAFHAGEIRAALDRADL